MNRKKELIRQYKETPRPAGVYRILHVPSGRALIGTSADAPAILNRLLFQLKLGGHPNKALQADWKADGADAFTLEVLDLLPSKDSGEQDQDEELRLLEAMWVEKLGVGADQRY